MAVLHPYCSGTPFLLDQIRKILSQLLIKLPACLKAKNQVSLADIFPYTAAFSNLFGTSARFLREELFMKLLPYCIFWGVLASLLVAFAPGKNTAPAQPEVSGRPCGGPPNYCANSTQNIVPETPMAPPAVNTPFRDPDFGSRMVRVTDANTLGSYQNGYYIGTSYGTDSSAEVNEWGKFDASLGPAGGYRFVLYSRGGGIIPFQLDPDSMRVKRLTGKGESYLSRTGIFNFRSPSFSYTNPDILYGSDGTRLIAYRFSKDSITPVYDFNKCPGLPSYISKPWLYTGGISNSGDDSKFSYYFGGSAQGETTFAVYYDRSANNGRGACYWYDTVTAMLGGTNMAPTPVAGGVGQLAPPAEPKVSPKPGFGSLPPGDYYVRITAVTRMSPQDGETTPSAEAGPIHLAAPGSITVLFPSKLTNATNLELVPGRGCRAAISLAGCAPFRVYIGTTRGKETLQTTAGPVGGASYTQTVPLNTASPRPPIANTAGYNVHNARLSKDGTIVRLDTQESDGICFWRAGTNQVVEYPPSNNWGGHQALGYSHAINDPNNYDMAEVRMRPLSDLAADKLLVNPLPSPRQWNDSHWSWSDANPSDTMPVCGIFYNSHGTGNGTQNVLTSPLLQITAPYDNEIVCVATAGPSRVWRFAHHRSSWDANDSRGARFNWISLPIGNVSQDGRFYLFSSNWTWSLGDEAGSHGCPSAGICRTDVFIVELH